MLMTNLHYPNTLLNAYLLGEAPLNDDANVKEALNKIMWKIVQCTLTTYALALRDFVDFVENWSPFFDTPPNEGPKLAPTRMVGFY